MKILGFSRDVNPDIVAVYEAANFMRGLSPSSGLYASVRGPRRIASKAELRDILVDAGLPKGAAEKVAKAGWSALSPEAQIEDALKTIRAATRSINARRDDAPIPPKENPNADNT